MACFDKISFFSFAQQEVWFSFSDHLSVVSHFYHCYFPVIQSSHLGKFYPYLAQSILEKRGFKFVNIVLEVVWWAMMGVEFVHRNKVFFFIKDNLLSYLQSSFAFLLVDCKKNHYS